MNVLCLHGIATVILIVKYSILKISTVHTKYTILVQYWATVCDAGPELKHWINAFHYEIQRLKVRVGLQIAEPCSPSCFHLINEWRITRHVHHWTNIRPFYRPTAMQAKRQYLLTLKQHGVDVSCLMELQPLTMFTGSVWNVLLLLSNTQCWFNAEQLSATLVPHWNSIWYRTLYFNLLNVEGAQRGQVGRVDSDKGPILPNQDSFMGLLPTCTSSPRHWS